MCAVAARAITGVAARAREQVAVQVIQALLPRGLRVVPAPVGEEVLGDLLLVQRQVAGVEDLVRAAVRLRRVVLRGEGRRAGRWGCVHAPQLVHRDCRFLDNAGITTKSQLFKG